MPLQQQVNILTHHDPHAVAFLICQSTQKPCKGNIISNALAL
jgi:hypothetical protein